MKNHIFLFIIFLFFSCSEKENIEPEENLKISDKYLNEVNYLRKAGCKCGEKFYEPAPEVEWDTELLKIATSHSKDMYDHALFSHIGSDSSTPALRLNQNQYFYTSFAENILTASGVQLNEKEVIDNWKQSPSHCINLMNPSFKKMAVGKFENYWTQILASK